MLQHLPEPMFLPRTMASFFLVLGFAGSLVQAQAPAPAPSSTTAPVPSDIPKTTPAQTPAQAPAANNEVTSRDTAPTFRVRVNLVLVRVVVRDGEGKPIRNLKQEDFQLFDNRKPQTIATFSMETPETRVVRNVNLNPADAANRERPRSVDRHAIQHRSRRGLGVWAAPLFGDSSS